MAQPSPIQRTIAADDNDLKNNRLGLMSQRQAEDLQQHINYYQARIGEIVQRSTLMGLAVTLGIVLLTISRVLTIPFAIGIAVVAVGSMAYMVSDFNRFIQQLVLDKEAGAVRIVKGRTSRYTLRSHPLYRTLRVEVHNYKVLDEKLLREFANGELYQVYVLPQSRVVISAEKLTETGTGLLR